MKIKKVQIKNFRNIVDLELDFNESTTIITGANGIGKSNSLNALMWLLSDTLLTDNYGVGENDIDSIIPNNFEKGMNTEVTLILDTNKKYTKIYKTNFKRGSNVISGHATELAINDIPCSKQEEFYNELYNDFDYTPVLKTLKIKEMNLFLDPLYALQKLDQKELRNLLVNLGCSVDANQLIKLKFEDLEPLNAQFSGKFDVARKTLKDKKNKLEKEIESLELALVNYANANYSSKDKQKLQALETKLDELKHKLYNLQNSENDNTELNELKLKLNDVENKKKTHILLEQQRIQQELMNESSRQADAARARQNKIDDETRDLKEKESKLIQEISLSTMRKSNIEYKLKDNQAKLETYMRKGQQLGNEKTDLSIKLSDVITSSFDAYTVCPECNTRFPINAEELEKFNKQKEEQANFYKDEIDKKTKERVELGNAVLAVRAENKDLQSELENLVLEIEQDKTELKNIQEQIQNISAKYPLETNQTIIDTNINVDSFNAELELLRGKIETLMAQDRFANEQQMQGLKIEISDIEEKIKANYILESQYKTKLDFLKKLDNQRAEYNNLENQIARVNEFIHTLTSAINELATKKTGIKFVMLEENLTNDGLKEVCYAVVDGVEFSNLNTSRKVEVGIKFIEKVKELVNANKNGLPILADRLESIDSVEKIKSLTKEQFICTRVDDSKTIKLI